MNLLEKGKVDSRGKRPTRCFVGGPVLRLRRDAVRLTVSLLIRTTAGISLLPFPRRLEYALVLSRLVHRSFVQTHNELASKRIEESWR